MTGFDSQYVPAGLPWAPVEHEVEKGLGSKKSGFSVVEIRQRCRDYALSLSGSSEKSLSVWRVWGVGKPLSHDELRIPGNHRKRIR